MCEIKLYSPGDIVDLSSGGVLLRGGLSSLTNNAKDAAMVLADHTNHKFGSLKMVKSEMNVSKQFQRNFILEKREEIKNLGEMARNLGVQKLDDGEFFGI